MSAHSGITHAVAAARNRNDLVKLAKSMPDFTDWLFVYRRTTGVGPKPDVFNSERDLRKHLMIYAQHLGAIGAEPTENLFSLYNLRRNQRMMHTILRTPMSKILEELSNSRKAAAAVTEVLNG